MEKRELFLKIFKKAEKKYGVNGKRLAGEGWDLPWKVVLVTICSAQNRDEVTIPVMENFFKKFDSLEKIAGADVKAIRDKIGAINYCDSKAKYLKESAKMLIADFRGRVPDNLDDLTKLPGVGRKTANLVLSEIYGEDTITVDTHVHRLSNVLGIVKTKERDKTEIELKKIVPRKYWSKINRIFVLWGKEVYGRDKIKLLSKLNE